MHHNVSIQPFLGVNLICQIPWKIDGPYSGIRAFVFYGRDKIALLDQFSSHVVPIPSWPCWGIYLCGLGVLK